MLIVYVVSGLILLGVYGCISFYIKSIEMPDERNDRLLYNTGF